MPNQESRRLHAIANITLVIAAFLVVISFVQPAAERLQVPYTVLLAFVGVTVGGVSSFLLYTPLTTFFDDIVAPIVNLPISAPIFLVVFLPMLLFHASLTIDLREIAQDAAPILTLAILAVFAAAAAIGFGLSLAGVPLAVGLLLGTIVATTDPAAVVTIFREVGAPPRLTRLLEGESLLNDAAAIVLFGIVVDALAGGTQPGLGAGFLHFAEHFSAGWCSAPSPAGCSAPYCRCWRVAQRRGHAVGGAALHRVPRRRRGAPHFGRRRGGRRRPDGGGGGAGADPAGQLALHRTGLGPDRLLGEFADLRHRLDAGAEAARRSRTAPCLAAADRACGGARLARRGAVRRAAAAQRAAA